MGMENNYFDDPEERMKLLTKEVRAWAAVTEINLQRRLASLGLRERARLLTEDSPRLRSSVVVGLKKHQGEIDYAWISFARHGIYLEQGTGRGRPVRSAKATAAAKHWLSVELPAAVEDLADRLASGFADVIAAEIKLNVPGVYSTKISGNG